MDGGSAENAGAVFPPTGLGKVPVLATQFTKASINISGTPQ
jgi:hypothetical protein